MNTLSLYIQSCKYQEEEEGNNFYTCSNSNYVYYEVLMKGLTQSFSSKVYSNSMLLEVC